METPESPLENSSIMEIQKAFIPKTMPCEWLKINRSYNITPLWEDPTLMLKSVVMLSDLLWRIWHCLGWEHNGHCCLSCCNPPWRCGPQTGHFAFSDTKTWNGSVLCFQRMLVDLEGSRGCRQKWEESLKCIHIIYILYIFYFIFPPPFY